MVNKRKEIPRYARDDKTGVGRRFLASLEMTREINEMTEKEVGMTADAEGDPSLRSG
jgi:hypothetical protein